VRRFIAAFRAFLRQAHGMGLSPTFVSPSFLDLQKTAMIRRTPETSISRASLELQKAAMNRRTPKAQRIP
jgi:hypothetical protein